MILTTLMMPMIQTLYIAGMHLTQLVNMHCVRKYTKLFSI